MYANRSMRGAHWLLVMKARSSRRALSISLRYSSSTTGSAIVKVCLIWDCVVGEAASAYFCMPIREGLLKY